MPLAEPKRSLHWQPILSVASFSSSFGETQHERWQMQSEWSMGVPSDSNAMSTCILLLLL